MEREEFVGRVRARSGARSDEEAEGAAPLECRATREAPLGGACSSSLVPGREPLSAFSEGGEG